MITRWVLPVVCSVCFLISSFVQSEIVLKEQWRPAETVLSLPSGPGLKIIALEFDLLAADLLWLKAVQFMGILGKTRRVQEYIPDDADYKGFYNLLDRITDLDSKFRHAYKSGAVALSVLSDYPDLAISILEKGIRYNPEDWEIPFYIGFNYLYHKNDPLKAAVYMEKASRLEGPPLYLPLLTSRLYNQTGNRETAILFLKGIYLTTKDAIMRQKIAERIIQLEQEKELEAVAPTK